MELSFIITALLSALAYSHVVSAAGPERVLGAYIFHRHGDRTAKSWNPVNLTALGADQVHSSGSFYRSRYVSSDGDAHISGLKSDVARLSQLAVSAPVDVVLHNSAVSFLQGLYPPTGTGETLANGTQVEGPLGGYQYIPVGQVGASGATSKSAESTAWLQGGSGCTKAVTSSNNYLSSSEFKSTYDESIDFYQSLLPVINGTFGPNDANFKNGYTIFDLINVAAIHNSSIPSDNLLTDETLVRLYDLASIHEWNLAYNESDAVRAIAGAVLAGEILESLQAIVNGTASAPTLNVQFGAYGSFMSFFGLAQLPNASSRFHSITNYASSMVFELFTTSTAAKPTPGDINVRFLYANGSAAEVELASFPLFGQSEAVLSWDAFQAGMKNFAIQDTQHWCQMCGNTDGQCASKSSGDEDATAHKSSGHGGGVSKPVAGVIGALVTLAVILGLESLVLLVGGLRVVKKAKVASTSHGSGPSVNEVPKSA